MEFIIIVVLKSIRMSKREREREKEGKRAIRSASTLNDAFHHPNTREY